MGAEGGRKRDGGALVSEKKRGLGAASSATSGEGEERGRGGGDGGKWRKGDEGVTRRGQYTRNLGEDALGRNYCCRYQPVRAERAPEIGLASIELRSWDCIRRGLGPFIAVIKRIVKISFAKGEAGFRIIQEILGSEDIRGAYSFKISIIILVIKGGSVRGVSVCVEFRV